MGVRLRACRECEVKYGCCRNKVSSVCLLCMHQYLRNDLIENEKQKVCVFILMMCAGV